MLFCVVGNFIKEDEDFNFNFVFYFLTFSSGWYDGLIKFYDYCEWSGIRCHDLERRYKKKKQNKSKGDWNINVGFDLCGILIIFYLFFVCGSVFLLDRKWFVFVKYYRKINAMRWFKQILIKILFFNREDTRISRSGVFFSKIVIFMIPNFYLIKVTNGWRKSYWRRIY